MTSRIFRALPWFAETVSRGGSGGEVLWAGFWITVPNWEKAAWVRGSIGTRRVGEGIEGGILNAFNAPSLRRYCVWKMRGRMRSEGARAGECPRPAKFHAKIAITHHELGTPSYPCWRHFTLPCRNTQVLIHNFLKNRQSKMSEEEASYIDYETFLDPNFSATAFANTLVLATNNASDTPLDLSTPLSRVLFDVQDIDTHIDTLTTKSALPLLEHTIEHADASGRILSQVESQVASLTESYKTLEKEVIERYEVAEQVRLTAERLVETVKLGRAVARCLMLGRQLEVRMGEVGGIGGAKKEDHRAMVRSADTLLSLRQLFASSGKGEEGEGLDRVRAVNTLRSELVNPGERSIASRAQQVVREFSMSSLLTSPGQTSASTFSQTEDTKARTTSALLTLYLLSPTPPNTAIEKFRPSLLLDALEDYLQTALKSSLASLARSLATLPSLDRTLLEVSARCQNIVALETLLESMKPPPHPMLDDGQTTKAVPNFLEPLLASLDTSSLPSYFWRSLASGLSPRVQELMHRGGVSARTLRSNKDRVREAIRDCVNRGSQLPSSSLNRGKAMAAGGWEREAAVMVGSIMGQVR